MRVSPVLIAMILAAGCSSSSGPAKDPAPNCAAVPPDSIRWAEHDMPACAGNGNIAFNDQGIVCAAYGGFGFDGELAGLWVLDVASGERRRILPAALTTFTWSPASTHLLVAAGHLYLVEIATQSVQQLTTNGAHFFPAWSQDGRWIAFDDGLDLWCMNADGSDLHKMAEPGRQPSFAPDGMSIVYSKAISPRFPGCALFVVHVDGTQERRLSQTPTEMLEPAWSPDGTRIAYTAQSIPGGAPEIWVIDADGAHARQVTRYSGAHAAWQPDGRHLVFGYPDGGCGSKDVGVLWSIDVDTREATQLTFAWPQRDCSSARSSSMYSAPGTGLSR